MKLVVRKNLAKAIDDDPDYLITQRQRNDEDNGYVMVEVGVGWINQTPDGEEYITLKVDIKK